MKTDTQYIEDNGDEGGERLAVRGRAFSTDNSGYERVAHSTTPDVFDRQNYAEFLTGTD